MKYPLPLDQYFQQIYKKTQIVLHHTASNGVAENVINGWKADVRKVATPYVINSKGVVYEAFDPKYWASAVGYFITGLGGNDKAYQLLPNTANKETNLAIELRTINIELTNWGGLTFRNGNYYNYVGGIVSQKEVETLNIPFRGSTFYEKYTTAQIQSLEVLIKELGAKFNIPLKFSQSFEFDKNAVLGTPGIYGHHHFRYDKSDMSPQPDLIKMLNSLS
jgi:hypothetical protein